MHYCSRAAESLMAESGCRLDHPAAGKFRQHVMDGDWNKADHDLQELRQLLGSSQSLIVSSTIVIHYLCSKTNKQMILTRKHEIYSLP